MKKPKRYSLAFKVNIVIMALVFSVSALLTLISEITYQETVFKPYFRKLEITEIPVDEMKPSIQEFRTYLGSEELNRVISESSEEDIEINLTETGDGPLSPFCRLRSQEAFPNGGHPAEFAFFCPETY